MCQARLEELHRLWDLLMKRLAERGRRLQLALDLLQYLREAEDLLYWISDKRNFVERQDLGRDLEHLEQIQVIVKKFEEFLQVRTRPDQRLPTPHLLIQLERCLRWLVSVSSRQSVLVRHVQRSYRTGRRRGVLLSN